MSKGVVTTQEAELLGQRSVLEESITNQGSLVIVLALGVAPRGIKTHPPRIEAGSPGSGFEPRAAQPTVS